MLLDAFFSGKEIAGFEEKLLDNSGKKLENFLKETVFAGLLLSLVFSIVSFNAGINSGLILFFGTIIVFLPLFLLVFFHLYWFEKNKREKEMLVPDALLQASAFPEGTDIVKIAKYLSNADFGLLGKEFGKVHSEVLKGASVKQAFGNMEKRCKSKIIERMCRLLVQGYESGAGMQAVLKEAADDLLETSSLVRERISALVIEKYTLLLAGGIIVPAVLGLIAGMISSLDFSSFSAIEIGLPPEQRKELLEAALLGNNFYIFEYALLASFFVAFQENNSKKTAIYFLLLLPASFLSYYIAKGF